MKVTMYHSRDDWPMFGGEIPSIMCLICHNQKIAIEHIVDTKKVLGILKGVANPYYDNDVIIIEDGTIIKDYFDLTKWIEEKGLRLC